MSYNRGKGALPKTVYIGRKNHTFVNKCCIKHA